MPGSSLIPSGFHASRHHPSAAMMIGNVLSAHSLVLSTSSWVSRSFVLVADAQWLHDG
jgi:hypothetical protein